MGRLSSKSLNPFRDRFCGVAIAVEQGPGLAGIKGQLCCIAVSMAAAQTWKGLIMGKPRS